MWSLFVVWLLFGFVARVVVRGCLPLCDCVCCALSLVVDYCFLFVCFFFHLLLFSNCCCYYSCVLACYWLFRCSLGVMC